MPEAKGYLSLLPVDAELGEFEQQGLLAAFVELDDGLHIWTVIDELKDRAETETVVLNPLPGPELRNRIGPEIGPGGTVDGL